MRKEQMAICDTDEKYVYRLQEILKQRASFPFEISVFTEKDSILKEEIGGKYRLYLAGEDFYELLQPLVEKDRLLLLKGAEGMPETADYIWKYQSADRIRQQIVDHFADPDKGEVCFTPGRKKGNLIGIFSPVCRELQSGFSVLLGQFLAKKESVLYLNFEAFSGLSRLLTDAQGRDLTDLVYYMEGGRDRLVYKLEGMVGNLNGLDYISPAFSFVDLAEVKEESWMLLIHTLKEMGQYDHILLDLSETVHGLLNILRECDRVYTITGRTGMAEVQLAQYEELLQKLEYGDVLRNTKKCGMPEVQGVPLDPEELPYSELASCVKEMIREEAL